MKRTLKYERDPALGDPILRAKMMAANKISPIPAPIEDIAYIDWLATAFNRDKLHITKHIARLACGHDTITRNFTKASCHVCLAMILNGEDYVKFRGIE